MAKGIPKALSQLKYAQRERHVLHVGRDWLKVHRKRLARAIRRSSKAEAKSYLKEPKI